MTAEAQRNAIAEMIKRRTRVATATREAARETLIKEGVYTSDGKLTPKYGGKAINAA